MLCTTVTSTASRSARSSGGKAWSLPTCSRGSTRSTRDEPGSSPRLSLADEDRTSSSGLRPSSNPPCTSHLPHLLTGMQCAADHRYNCRWSVENVPGGEAEKSVPAIDQAVLAAVVGGEALAMR